VDPLIGKKIKQLREINGYTQEEISRLIGIDRSKLSQVENGKLGVSNEELYRIGRFFGQHLEYFFEEEVSPTENILLFRAKGNLSEEDFVHVKECQDIAMNFTELEELVFEEEARPSFRTYSTPAQAHYAKVAKAVAKKERLFLGLNPKEPVPLRPLLEEQGILILEIPFKSETLDGFFFIYNKQPIIIANSHEKNPFSRNFIIAHELAHVLLDSGDFSRFCYSILEESKEILEKRANSFANEFLLPEEGVDIYFTELGYNKGRREIQKFDLYRLIDRYQLSREIIVNRIFHTGWISEEQRERFLEIEGIARDMERLGFKNEYTRYYIEKKEEQKPSRYLIFDMLPERYKELAMLAYVKSKITFSKLCEYLFLPKDEVSSLFGIEKREPTTEEVLGIS
jgi:Zn-dependent peptidase ImmA (M78 family)/DNA-binding XRE family transcriptional regulator